ncbi:amino acid adenylation domain-containing protein [Sorangium sp. So ce1097]|uniref:amino acid adenylation domain-containing protein n=1 Tax=Sorangium sp. So ce1097 TaxID=3133330 RepID=UPI003F5EC81C
MSVAPDTLADLLRARAALHPGRCAFTFLADGEEDERSLSYAALDAEARALAARLGQEVRPGDRALLVLPSGLEFLVALFGCLYAGVVAVPLYPPGAGRPLAALRAIAASSGAAIALTQRALLGALAPSGTAEPPLGALRAIAVDDTDPSLAERFRPPPISPGDPAILQYTSGSTALPRGVIVDHACALANERMIAAAFEHDERSTFVGWLPLHHDMGLIGNVLQPLFIGARSVLLSPAHFLERPMRWLEAVSRYCAHTSGGPSFAYELCARKIEPARRSDLDLSGWRIAFNGAEPVRAATIARFTNAFRPFGFRPEAFYPCYGLAEATLFVTGGHKGQPPCVRAIDAEALRAGRADPVAPTAAGAREVVGCGRPAGGLELLIVSPESRAPCAAGEVGEVWIAGPSVAAGYHGRPEETRETFGARLADGRGPFLRTGDLGFLLDGELFIAGRRKDVIILRGRCHHPHDLEATAGRCHPALRAGGGAAFGVEDGDEERAVLVHEVAPGELDGDEVIQAIRGAIAEEHGVQPAAVVLVARGGVPRTSSGKTQRQLCRERFARGELPAVAAWLGGMEVLPRAAPASAAPPDAPLGARGVEAHLVRAIARILGTAEERIDRDRALPALGLDSLAAVELGHAVSRALGVRTSLSAVLEAPSLRALAEAIAREARTPAAPLAAAAPQEDERSPMPLSVRQHAMWLAYQLTPDQARFHLRGVARLRAEIPVDRFSRAIGRLVERHPMLRATFGDASGQPEQRIGAAAPGVFSAVDAAAWSEQETEARALAFSRQPFDLERGPLLRAALFTAPGRPSIVAINVHHAIADLWSFAVLLDELDHLLGDGADLPPLGARYADLVRGEPALSAAIEAGPLLGRRVEALRTASAALELSLEGPRPPVRTFRAGQVRFEIDAATTRALQVLGERTASTAYVLLLAAYEALIHHYTGADAFLVGSPTWGRGAPELERVVGCYVNTVVLRADLSGDPSFLELVERARRDALEALALQDYPYPLLVRRLRPERDPSRPPLVQALFTFQKAPLLHERGMTALALGAPGARLDLQHLALEALPSPMDFVDFDLDMAIGEVGGGLAGYLAYDAELIPADTAERMVAEYVALLRRVAADPTLRVCSTSILTDEEREAVLVRWNRPRVEVDGEVLLHRVLRRQIARTPDHAAVVTSEGAMSYRELGDRAARLAGRLGELRRGTPRGPWTPRTGLLLEAGWELVAAMFGSLEAGTCFVPLDPEDPESRTRFVLDDCGVEVIVTARRHLDLARALARDSGSVREVIALDAELAPAELSPADQGSDPDADVYVVYTSGTTGAPKGVPISHRNLAPLLAWQAREFRLGERTRTLQTLSVCFDFGLQEILTTVLYGGTLFALPVRSQRDPRAYVEMVRRHEITMVYATPSFCELVTALDIPLPSIELVLLGGELLAKPVAQRLLALLREEAVVWNGYGPSEASINCAMFRMDRAFAARCRRSRSVPIGEPTGQSRLYVLDRRRVPVPIGVPGELYIGGPGVARGYHRRPELSAERFLPDPFVDTGDLLYVSGDRVRLLPDGNLEFLGRIDRQVKIRGFRVEPDEVEVALKQHPGIADASVVVRTGAPGGAELVACVVRGASGPEPSSEEVRSYLGARLPRYMIPSAVVFLDRLPCTPNGKVDQRELGQRCAEAGVTPGGSAGGGLERAIAALWEELLEVPRVEATDNFFELGGHSLLVLTARARLAAICDRDIPLVALFEHPTVASLARYLRGAGVEAHPGGGLEGRAERQRSGLSLLRGRLRRGRADDE